ncbi:MAG TPA: hypothetical protein VH255_10895 [Verrucomicrobiae bacterium]|jgi:hypothetical protein|nr:hypothetical protein [Verrucomicrobiae bacterium]
MNNDKLTKLFAAARTENPPAPPANFDGDVMRAIHSDVPTAHRSASLFDQLDLFFPKIAWAAVLIICVCVAGEIFSSANSPALGDGIAEISDQWTFTTKGF